MGKIERDPDAAERSADDWLADRELDWLDAPLARPTGADSARSELESATEILRIGHAAVQRRRLVAGLVLLVLLGSAIALPLVVFRGGPATQPTTAVTTVQTSTASPARTAATTTTTTPTPAANPPAVELPAGGTMRRGEPDAAAVTKLQQVLIALGYKKVKADGVFGTGTQAAVVAFQRSHGLPDDSIVGKATADALNQALAAKSP